MRTVFGAVHTEPICTRQPDFIAVLIIEPAADCVQPVIVVRILFRLCVQCSNCRNRSCNSGASHHASQQNRFPAFPHFHKKLLPFSSKRTKNMFVHHYTGYQKKSQALLGKIYEMRKMTGLHFCLHCVIIEVFDFYRLPEVRRAFL